MSQSTLHKPIAPGGCASKSVGYAIARPTPEAQGGYGARSFASWTDGHINLEEANGRERTLCGGNARADYLDGPATE
jgi:hypothetical protein